MSNVLYLECYSGISGDMTVAALLDLGADQDKLSKALSSLPIDGYETRITRVKKAGIDACDFHVILDQEHENHDHDMEYLHGHDEHTDHEHSDHLHGDHDHVHHHHEHRNLADILSILNAADLSERARNTAIRIFQIIAEAEARAHGTDVEHVHFHEVGAVDSIVDITAVAVCLDDLDITEVIIPELSEGRGTIRCQHGILPIPVPAVAQIVSRHCLKLHMTGVHGELVTPTGAAIAAAIRTKDSLPITFEIERIGIGAGKREYEIPSMLRAMLIHEGQKEEDCIYKLESNIDDCTGEMMGYTMERLMLAGARDVYFTPVFMKKNRPAYQINVICTPADIERLESIIFMETTTIGIRRIKMERTILPREIIQFESSLGKVQIKKCTSQGKTRYYPEYEGVKQICSQHGISYMEAYRIIQGEYEEYEHV